MGKRHKPEEIIAKLRQVEVMTGQGTSIGDAIRSQAEFVASRTFLIQLCKRQKCRAWAGQTRARPAHLLATAHEIGVSRCFGPNGVRAIPRVGPVRLIRR
jgi:hypothetical protein